MLADGVRRYLDIFVRDHPNDNSSTGVLNSAFASVSPGIRIKSIELYSRILVLLLRPGVSTSQQATLRLKYGCLNPGRWLRQRRPLAVVFSMSQWQEKTLMHSFKISLAFNWAELGGI